MGGRCTSEVKIPVWRLGGGFFFEGVYFWEDMVLGTLTCLVSLQSTSKLVPIIGEWLELISVQQSAYTWCITMELSRSKK